MNLPYFIAKKYFFSRKKRSFIHFISLISIVGVCVGTAALIIVLSVFNGLEDLNRTLFKTSNPDISITAASSKTFDFSEEQFQKIKAIDGIKSVTQVIKDNALAKRENEQVIVVVKGVDSTFQYNSPLRDAIYDGELITEVEGKYFAFVGGGLYNALGLMSFNYLRPLELWYPKNQKPNLLNPEDNISKIIMPVSGAFVLEQQYDNYVYIPIDAMEELTEQYGKRTAYEIYVTDTEKINNIKGSLKSLMGDTFKVQDQEEQNEALYRAIKIEKLFIFIALLFIIGISSFNIFFALSMLVLDKKDDIQTMYALGTSKTTVRNIFLIEGALISLSGAIVGLIFGVGICWSQMQFGWLKMGMQYAIVDAYPIVLKAEDVILAMAGIIVIAFLASILPAHKASKILFNQ